MLAAAGCGSAKHPNAATTTSQGDSSGSSSSLSDGGIPIGDAATTGAYDGPVADGSCPNLPAQGAWQNISPPGSNYTKSYSGMVSVVVRPDDPAIVYAGADSAGIFKSTDCGAHWALVNTGANAQAMSSGRPWSLVIDPVTPDRMYAVEGYGTSGLWMSENAGTDWTQILTPNITAAFNAGGQITSVALDPGDHTHIVVESHQGQDTAAGMCGTNTCLAETTNSGQSWKLLTIPIPWAEDTAVAIVDRNTWIYCSVYAALWYTIDEGATWKNVPVPNGSTLSCNWYQPYVFQTANHQYVLPATIQGGNAGVFLSNPNDVTTWTAIPNSPQGQMLMATGSSLIVGAGRSSATAAYSIAAQSDTSTWKPFPGPNVGSVPSGAAGGFPEFMDYDGVHHVLYVSTYTTGLWQTVIP